MISQEKLSLDEKFSVSVQIAEIPAGSSIENVPDWVLQQLKRQQCIVQVLNGKDKMCLSRCFVLASTRVEKGVESEEYEKMLKNCATQREAAKALLEKLGLPDREMSLADIPTLAKVRMKLINIILRIKFIRNSQNFAFAFLDWTTHAALFTTTRLKLEREQPGSYSRHFAV